MEGGPSPWFVLLWLLWLGLGIAGWIRYRGWKSEMDEQVDVGQASFAPTDGPIGTVTFFRRNKLVGMRITYYISCDGTPIASLKNARYLTVRVPAGKHVFSLTDAGDVELPSLTVDLRAEEEMFIDCTTSGLATGVTLQVVGPAEAREQLKGLKPA